MGPVLPSHVVSTRVRPGAPAVDDENDEPGGLIVDYFRLDPTRALGRALGIGSLIVTLGGVVMGAAIILPRFDPEGPVYAVHARAGDGIFTGGEVTADGTPIERDAFGWEIGLGLFGLACIVGGAATAIIGLRGVLSEESYLALRTDGAYFRTAEERSLVRWEEIESVRWDPSEGVVRFVRHDGSTWVRAESFAGIDGEELAKRAGEVRRKALFGLIRTTARHRR